MVTGKTALSENNCKDFYVNKAQREVGYGGCTIRLTQKEFDILLQLLSERGRVFGRQEIIKHVWGGKVYVTERTIDAHIVRLRRKLRSLGDHAPPIDTFRVQGYRLRD